MKLTHAFAALRRYLTEDRGVIALETVVITPLLFLGLLFSYEYYGMIRQQSLQDKATYTVADMLSRETTVVDDTYIDNTKRLFDMLTKDVETSQLRVSVVRYHRNESENIDEFELRWTALRGDGSLTELDEPAIGEMHGEKVFPDTLAGQDLIMVETRTVYRPQVSATGGLSDETPVSTRFFMPLRFAPQLCFEGVCEPA